VSQEIVIDWSVPASDGGALITFYEVSTSTDPDTAPWTPVILHSKRVKMKITLETSEDKNYTHNE
jgi:hypothetical protein